MKLNLPRIRFYTVLLVFLSLYVGQSAFADTTTVVLPNNKGIKEKVQTLFVDAPQMVSVAQCESSFQQYTIKGTTFTGARGAYVGVFQIAKGHAPYAKKLGFDIYTLDGNLGYARYMYDHEGTRPWSGCVKGKVVSTKPLAKNATVKLATIKNPTVVLTKNMGLNATDPEVVTIQKILNASGFFVSKTGIGSPGQETNMFGTKTSDALKRFQCIHNIVCSGSENTTGYGYVGPATRAALLQEAKKQGL